MPGIERKHQTLRKLFKSNYLYHRSGYLEIMIKVKISSSNQFNRDESKAYSIQNITSNLFVLEELDVFHILFFMG